MIVQNHHELQRTFVVPAQTRFAVLATLLNRNNAGLYFYFSEKLLCLPNDLTSTAVLTNKTDF